MKKKIILLVLCLAMISSFLSGCSTKNHLNVKNKINIVCTIFPQYDWVMNLLGDRADEYNVILLVDNGVDLHSYQPSARDIVTIATCDLFIYAGGESDSWVKDVLDQADNPDMIAIRMLDVIGDQAYIEELVEGMEDSDKTLSSFFTSRQNEEEEYDEHVWLSLKNAAIICSRISDALCALDTSQDSDISSIDANHSENSPYYDNYSRALKSYSEKLATLDQKYSKAIANSKKNVLLFGDRFPFRYLMEDYNLKYYAAFSGCSAETEASFKTIVFLAGKLDSLGLSSICVTETSDQSVAQTILENSKNGSADIVVVNSMQAITAEDIDAGVTYIGTMESNLSSIVKALN